MILYTLDQRWAILRHYFENHSNLAECVRKMRTDFGRRETPSAPCVPYLMKKVKETVILIDKPKTRKAKNSAYPLRILLLQWQKVFVKRHQQSIHRRSQQLNI